MHYCIMVQEIHRSPNWVPIHTAADKDLAISLLLTWRHFSTTSRASRSLLRFDAHVTSLTWNLTYNQEPMKHKSCPYFIGTFLSGHNYWGWDKIAEDILKSILFIE